MNSEFGETSWEIVIAFVSIFLALIALVIAVSSNYNQLKSTIINQLTEKANIANRFAEKVEMKLNEASENELSDSSKYNVDILSSIFHSIENAELTLKQWNKNSIWFGFMNQEELKLMFYCQLSHEVTENLKKDHNFDKYLNRLNQKSEKTIRLKSELIRIQNFLNIPRENYSRLKN